MTTVAWRACWPGCAGNAPSDRAALIDALVRAGRMAAEHPEIAELDLNPVVVLEAGQGVYALDARVVLRPKELNVKPSF